MKVVIVSGPDQGKVCTLVAGNNFIGRAEENSLVLPSNQVSRRHACISVIDNRTFMEDLGSSNGTHLNGQRITQKVELVPGAFIQIGEFVMQYSVDGYALPPQSAIPALVTPGPAAARGAPAPAFPFALPSRKGPGPGQPNAPIYVHAARNSETTFWKAYRSTQFLGWRGQVILLTFFGLVLTIGLGVYPVILVTQQAMVGEVIKRGEVLASKLAMRNGEFIRNRQETNLDTASFLAEPGVVGAFLLSKEFSVLSPVEQRGRSKVNDVSREAVRGLVVKEETAVQADGVKGTYHIAVPIKVWSNEVGNYETHGVAYLVFDARRVAQVGSDSNIKFITSATVITLILTGMVVLLVLLTIRPLQALKEDAELVMRGDLRATESRARWSELEALSVSLNRSFERYQQLQAAGSAGGSGSIEMPGASFAGQPQTSTPVGSLPEDAKVEAVSNAVAEGVVITDDLQRVVYLNKVAERQFGVPLNRVKNRHIMEVIGNQDILGAVLDLFRQLLTTDDQTVSATIPVSDGGANRQVSLVLSGVKSQTKQLEYAAIVIS